MAVDMQEKNGGRIIEVRVTGKLTQNDYERFVPHFEHAESDQARAWLEQSLLPGAR